MGILTRFGEIISANINAMLDKAEDPAKMVDQYLRQMREDLAQVKRETAGVMAQEKSALREVDRLKDEIAKDMERANKALTAGSENDARVFLERKQRNEAILTDADKAWRLANDNASRMRQMHDKLVADIQALESRKNTIKSKAAVAKTQETINRMGSASDKFAGTSGKMNAMEAKVNERLDRAMAEAELNETPPDEASALEARYDGGSSVSVDDELNRMKAALGISNNDAT